MRIEVATAPSTGMTPGKHADLRRSWKEGSRSVCVGKESTRGCGCVRGVESKRAGFVRIFGKGGVEGGGGRCLWDTSLPRPTVSGDNALMIHCCPLPRTNEALQGLPVVIKYI